MSASPKTKPHLLMCAPTFFRPREAHPVYGFANAFEASGRALFERDPPGFRAKSMEQWLALRDVFSRFATIIELEPREDQPDMVYIADGSFSLHMNSSGRNRIDTVIARFTNAARNEFGAHMDALENREPNRIFHFPPYAVEGGDLLYDPFRDWIWGGYHKEPNSESAAEGRTDIRSHMLINKKLGPRVFGVETSAMSCHLHNMLAPLSRGHVIVNEKMLPENFMPKLLKAAFDDFTLDAGSFIIPVPIQDMFDLTTNVRCFGHTVIAPACSPQMQYNIRSANYELITLDLSCFHAGGGSVHSLGNIIDQPRVAGGYYRMGGEPPPLYQVT